jgi:hypothetical protein
MTTTVKKAINSFLWKNKPGYMSIEVMGVILFVALMIGYVAWQLSATSASANLSMLQGSLTTMSMHIQKLYSGSNNYSGLNNALAIKSGLVPQQLLKGESITTPWGGPITLAPGSDSGTFTVSVAGIKESDCILLATYQRDVWESVTVNGSTLEKKAAVASATSLCSGASNTIVYTRR